MKPSIPDIDKQIETGFKLRYSNPGESIHVSRDALAKSEKIRYDRGIAYARLNLAIASFLQSQTREAFELITQSLEYFRTNTT
jgi:hypothetical protein